MENFMIIFFEKSIISRLSEIQVITNTRISTAEFIGTFDLSDNHSCVIFANEEQFDLTLIKEISELLGFEVSIGMADIDEMEWMTSLDLAA